MKNINKIIMLLTLTLSLAFLNSCEDKPPLDYVQSKYLEGYLIVDSLVEGIVVMNSQPVNMPFDREKAMIKDADVKLVFGGTAHTLIYREGEKSGYYLPDMNIKVLPETKYEIIINTPDGSLITSETTTPKRMTGWIKAPRPDIYYPQDTLKLPKNDSLVIQWDSVAGVHHYLIRTLARDTVDYGRYLNPPVNEQNRRTYNVVSNAANDGGWYRNRTNWALIANSSTPTVWLAFKWFGYHDVSVYNPDPNMLNWFVNIHFTGTSENNPLLNSVKGGYGVFGSASVISKEIFLYKNQP